VFLKFSFTSPNEAYFIGRALIEGKKLMSDLTQKSCLYLAKPDLVKEWHPTKNGNLTPKNVTTKHDGKIWWLCEVGHEWEATVKDRIKGMGCPSCAGELIEEKYRRDEDSASQQKSYIKEDNISQQTHPVPQADKSYPYLGRELRKYPRYSYKATAMIDSPISGNSVYGQMQNFSKGGMGFETNAFFSKGDKVRIKFNTPPFFSKSKILPSTVMWSKELTDEEGYNYGYGVGLKFG
jgi:hypothetical protein